ncbi:hypothetical protein K3495_g11546 [Podosphaera aphanis]|nr:hypothetical protein K3495_g11546 [Podosphaera aphanis]
MRISPPRNKIAEETVSRKRNLSEYINPSDVSIYGDRYKSTREEWNSKNRRAMFNTPYQLSRGIHGSTLGLTQTDGNEYGQLSYRRSLRETNMPNTTKPRMAFLESAEKYSTLSDNHFRGDNERWEKDHDLNVTNSREGWNSVAIAIQAVNAVAEKAWEFCKSSAAIFRGFHAGGGTKYNISNPGESKFNFEPIERQDPCNKLDPIDQKSGNWNLNYDTTDEQTASRPTKRRQLYANNSESLDKNWVVVSPTPATPILATPIKTQRAPARCGIPVLSSARRLPTYSNTSIYSASQAGSVLSTPRKSALPSPKPRLSHAGSPTLSPCQRASFASPRSSACYLPSPATSRISPPQKRKSDQFLDTPVAVEAKLEAQRWAASLKKEERKQDESIQRLDSRLKAMIREGKEALGTQIGVNNQDHQSSKTRSAKVKRWRY